MQIHQTIHLHQLHFFLNDMGYYILLQLEALYGDKILSNKEWDEYLDRIEDQTIDKYILKEIYGYGASSQTLNGYLTIKMK